MMFEKFYLSVFPQLFYKWILLNFNIFKEDGVECSLSEDDTDYKAVYFKMSNVEGSVTIWNIGIVEEKIYLIEDKSILFYLHYKINHLSQCQSLFEEFYQALLENNKQTPLKIALCCSGGLSTAVFVEYIKEAADYQNLSIYFASLSVNDIKEKYKNFDALYLAPQISYLQPSIIETTNQSIPVHRINPTDFATKNYQSIINTIKNNNLTDSRLIDK